MPGKFKVAGSFVLQARNRLIIYGDVVQGTVGPGEELRVPLNGSFAMTVPIESVEMVDGTQTGSHVALVVARTSLSATISSMRSTSLTKHSSFKCRSSVSGARTSRLARHSRVRC